MSLRVTDSQRMSECSTEIMTYLARSGGNSASEVLSLQSRLRGGGGDEVGAEAF